MSLRAPHLTTEQIYIETSEYAIVGAITLPEVQRVSDALNNRDRDFLALADVLTVSKIDGSEGRHSFLAVGRQHIVVALALGDPGALDEQDEPCGLAARLRGRGIGARATV